MSIFDEGLVSLETLYRDNTGRRDPVWQVLAQEDF